MEVLPVDERDVDRRAPQPADGEQAAEAASDDDHPVSRGAHAATVIARGQPASAVVSTRGGVVAS